MTIHEPIASSPLTREIARASASPRPFRILILCSGNIARSVAAEVLLKLHLKRNGLDHVEVESAGTSDVWAGHETPGAILDVLAEYGAGGFSHVARKATAQDVASADLVLCCDRLHLAWIYEMFPVHFDKKAFLLSQLLGAECQIDVADPIPSRTRDSCPLGESDKPALRRMVAFINTIVSVALLPLALSEVGLIPVCEVHHG